MPRLGIVTFHSSFNEGAVLQALALTTHLSRRLPDWKVEIVDLYYASKQQAYEKGMSERDRAIQEFSRDRLPLSTEKYVIGQRHQEAVAKLAERYEGLVYGSDEIWKLRYRRRLFGFGEITQNDPFYPAFPNAYWPDPTLKIPRFAYAVCAGETRPHLVPDEHRAIMRDSIASLSLLGVRDTETRRFVEWLDPLNSARVQHVPDPTFSVSLIDETHVESARQKLTSWGVDFSRPTVAVICRHDRLIEPALQHLRSLGYQSVGLVLKNGLADLDLSSKPLTPLEWMASFRLFDLCLSERMHACISCLLQQTPVIALDFLKDHNHQGSKVENLFDTFGLAAFHYSVHFQEASELVRMCKRIKAGDWPDEHVKGITEKLRIRSAEFASQMSEMLSSAVRSQSSLPV